MLNAYFCMKKGSTLLLLICIMSSISAQKNVVKWNVASLFLKNVSLSYERVLTPRLSVNLQGGVLIQRNLPTWIADKVWQNTGDANQLITVGKPRFSGWTFTPEVRYYLLKKQDAPDGLYAAAYLRTWSYTGKINVYFQESSGFKSSLEGKVNYYAIRPGVQIGYQWLIEKRVSIDTYLGANYGLNGVNVYVGGPLVTDTYDVFMNKFLEEAKIQGEITQKIAQEIKNKFGSYVDHANFNTNFGLPGFRAGITLGYAF